jgi:DNA-binding NarL/FixJ family response regulator
MDAPCSPVRLLLVSRHTLTRAALARLIADRQSLELVGEAGSRIGALTQRERQVVRLVWEGLKNKQIAGRLSIADVTVRHHLTSIFSKLDVTDRLSLVVFAFRNGLALAEVGPKHASTVQSRQSPLS